MNDFRPLRDVFDEVAAGSAVDLPAGVDSALLAQALVSYCETAGIEVAEHLEEFTSAVQAHGSPDLASGLHLLATAPTPNDTSGVEPDGDPTPDGALDTTADTDLTDSPSDDLDIDFGAGTDGVDAPVAPDHSDPAPQADLLDHEGATGADEMAGEAIELPGAGEDWWGPTGPEGPESTEPDAPEDSPTTGG